MKKLLILMILFPLVCLGQTRPHWLQIDGKPFADVRTFGAKGDGVTDDTAAITAAIASAAASGKSLYLTGSYSTTALPVIPRGVKLVGPGSFTNYPHVLTEDRVDSWGEWPDFRWWTPAGPAIAMYNDEKYIDVQMNGLYGLGSFVPSTSNNIWVRISSNMPTTLADTTVGDVQQSTWYASFVAINDSTGALEHVTTPFFRIIDDSSNVLTIGSHLGYIGSSTPEVAQDFGMADDELVGQKFIVLANYRSFHHLGQVREITANTGTTITYDGSTMGLSASSSWIMVSPPGYTSFRYVGGVQRDTVGPVNFTKNGTEYQTRGGALTFDGVPSPLGSSTVATAPVYINDRGAILPTARTILLSGRVLSKASQANVPYGLTYLTDTTLHDIYNQRSYTTQAAQQAHQSQVWLTPRYALIPAMRTVHSATATASFRLYCHGYRE